MTRVSQRVRVTDRFLGGLFGLVAAGYALGGCILAFALLAGQSGGRQS